MHRKNVDLLRLGFGHVGSLLVNPTSLLHTVPVLDCKVIDFAMENMPLHQLVHFMKVEEGNHWIAVVFRMVVGVPQEKSNQKV